MDPINYGAGFQDPTQSFKDALAMGSGMLQAQQSAEVNALNIKAKGLAVQASEVEAKRQADVAALFEKLKQPGATAKDYMDLAMTLDKDGSAAFVTSFKTLKSEERQAMLIDSSQIFAAFEAGRPDIAAQLIRRQGAAESANNNEQGGALSEVWAKMAESGPEGAQSVKVMFGISIGALPDGDKAMNGITKYAQELRDQQDFPVLFATKQAALGKAKTDEEKSAIELDYAKAIAAAKARTDTANAISAEAKANNAPVVEGAAATTAAANAGVAVRVAEATAVNLENAAQISTITLKTLPELKQAELDLTQDAKSKADIELKYADPKQAAELLLTQGQAQGQQITLKTLEDAKAIELSTAKTKDAKDKVELKYAEPIAAAQLLLAQGNANAVTIKNKTLAQMLDAELGSAQDQKAIDDIKLKYADPQALADLTLSQGKATEQTIILQTLADEKKAALAIATSTAVRVGIESEFALRTQQVMLDQSLANVGLTMEQTDKSKVDKAIASAKEARDVGLFPSVEARTNADAVIAKANATVAEINAKYAERIKIADLEKYAKDAGLTTAQTNKTILEGANVSVDTAKVLMDIEGLKKYGGVGADKIFGFEDTIRKEYNSRLVIVNTMKQTYGRIKASTVTNYDKNGPDALANGASDVALVFGFMKMLDPGSVVRESEFAVAEDTTGLYGKLEVLYPKLAKGERLTKEQRADFISLAGKYMDASNEYEKRVKDDLSIAVKNYGLNPANVFGVGSPDIPRTPGTTTPAPTGSAPAVTGGIDLAALRTYIKTNNSKTKMNIDSMTEAQLASEFPNGYAAFKAANPVQEVDY